MAYVVNGRLEFLGLENGKPVFSDRQSCAPCAGPVKVSTVHCSDTAAPAAPPARPGNAEANTYRGTCGTCGKSVEAQAGVRRKISGKWQTFHSNGDEACVRSSVALPSASHQAPHPVHIPIPQGSEVLQGRFTIEDVEGTHLTLRVLRQPADARFQPGADLISYLAGGEYVPFAQVSKTRDRASVWSRYATNSRLVKAVRILVQNPTAVRQASCCMRCSKWITNPKSLNDFLTDYLGPECRKKAAA